MIITERFLKEEQTPSKNKLKKGYNPKTLKQIARENLKTNDKELDKEVAKKMINPYYFIDEKVKINLESHDVNYENFSLMLLLIIQILELKQEIQIINS